jgi:hypothetical protein
MIKAASNAVVGNKAVANWSPTLRTNIIVKINPIKTVMKNALNLKVFNCSPNKIIKIKLTD